MVSALPLVFNLLAYLFAFFLFSLSGLLEKHNPQGDKLFFISNEYLIFSSGWDWIINYPKTPEHFMCFIFYDSLVDAYTIWKYC